MRKYNEPTCRNLLRRPLIMGVPFVGLLALAISTIGIQVLGQGSTVGNAMAAGFGAIGYAALRIFTRFARAGWDESVVFFLERLTSRGTKGRIEFQAGDIPVLSPDTLDDAELIATKQQLEDEICTLKPGERLTWLFELGDEGALARRIRVIEGAQSKVDLEHATRGICRKGLYVYSLGQLPVVTDPKWFSMITSRIGKECSVIVSTAGLEQHVLKAQVEGSRRQNARTSDLTEVDSEITFAESTTVLQGLSRGDETLVEIAVVILSEEKIDLDPRTFIHEKRADLPVFSALGLRRIFHRSHIVRTVTAADLVPNLQDPWEAGTPILKTIRENALYFDPQDGRLEALHWLVAGASGSGKSFFTGLVLKRLVERGVAMSVLFIDHNRSFRRLVRQGGGVYLEPESETALEARLPQALEQLGTAGAIAGIELSDLSGGEKKAATRVVLEGVEKFLRSRMTTHPVYVVMDECWNFLKDEPALVQRFFREFRKLNGAVIAITQSLSDFLMDESGRSIFQNAPIRILLRQGEDLADYRGVLGINDVELSLLRLLRQSRGSFSECLIKTPFLSRFGRLYPTKEEYETLRTDNIRAELIEEARTQTRAVCV